MGRTSVLGKEVERWEFALTPAKEIALGVQDIAPGSYILVTRCGEYRATNKVVIAPK